VLEARKLSQADAANVLGVTQPKVSALRHYKLAGFSVERLMNLLAALDQDVEIVIRRKPRSQKTGRIAERRTGPGAGASPAAAWGRELRPRRAAPQTPHFVSPENRYCGRLAPTGLPAV
jgi:transcriptional regulator with XRE-family HTH domain